MALSTDANRPLLTDASIELSTSWGRWNAMRACLLPISNEKLRRERRHARQMMIFVHNSPFDTKEAYYSRQASLQLPHATSDTAELILHACHALTRLYQPGVHYSKCGVMLTELTPEDVHRGNFLDTRDRARSRQLRVG